MKHKYYDAIVAWASGENVQYRTPGGEWMDYLNIVALDAPSFFHYEWRVKPKTKKVAIFASSLHYFFVCTKEEEYVQYIKDGHKVVKDWFEVEIP